MISSSPSRFPAAFLLGTLSLFSAFLLFQVQPIISKFILPWFGGSPSVWTHCMVFFQVVLFLGYAYAHVLTRLPLRAQAVIHTVLVLGAICVLPIAPDDQWKPTGDEEPSGRILLLLLSTVGLPYFILSSTSPLTQVWFTRAVPGGVPWRLYALSNIGSLTALLSYPFVIEPLLEVTSQTWIWSAAFVVFALLSVALLWKSSTRNTVLNTPKPESKKRPHWGHRLLWLGLPALASAVLLATSNHASQDVAVVPFMWVIPLSLYLLTFILCFEHDRWYQRWLWPLLAMAVIFLLDYGNRLPDKQVLFPNYFVEVIFSFSSLFLICMVCHGELARMRPSPAYLTEFYLFMSAGGAVGGMLVSLVAPHVFNAFTEWPISQILGFVIAGIALAIFLLSHGQRLLSALAAISSCAIAVVMSLWAFKGEPPLEQIRNFYGVVFVEEGFDDSLQSFYRRLTHGAIEHGVQNLESPYREEPVTYYGRHTGIGKALEYLQNTSAAKVGVVGLGAGTVGCYAQSGHTYRFYEINTDVVRLARKYFTYLDDAEKRGAKVEIAMGDARLVLEKEAPQEFDVLLLDAFSGDAIPMHLLTREAFEIYHRHMKPEGIIAVHITNTYLYLAPVVEKQAAAMGWHTTRIITEDQGDDNATDYLLLTPNRSFLAQHPSDVVEDEPQLNVPLWTDRYHNLFQILIR